MRLGRNETNFFKAEALMASVRIALSIILREIGRIDGVFVKDEQ